jgi:aldehyde:ferredoxin oxidoreductase
MSEPGYAGNILRVDLSSGRSSTAPTEDYADRFLGGRGLASKIYWDEVPPEVSALDPASRIIFATGPLGGLPAIGGSRWIICGKAAGKNTISYANLGGRWGAELKFAGYDAIVVHGQSEKPVYLLIDGDKVEIRDAQALWGKGTIEIREALKAELGDSARVVAIGPAGENMAVMASFLADNDASGSGQLAASAGAKRLKAIVVKGAGKKVPVGRPEKFKEMVNLYREMNIAFPSTTWPQISRWSRDLVLEFRVVPDQEMKVDPCYGCLGRCARRTYQAADGTKGKFLCHSAYFYQPLAERYYGEWNDVPFHATKLCDNYGLGIKGVDRLLGWLDAHYRAGILTEKDIGLPLSKIGSQEVIEVFLRKIALREDIGDTLARGLDEVASALLPEGQQAVEYGGFISEPGFHDPYSPRLYSTHAFVYAMEPTFAIQQLHEIGYPLARWRAGTLGLMNCTNDTVRGIARAFWGGEAAADFSTIEGKALAASMIQDRQIAKECLVLCDFLWPLTFNEHTEDHIGDPTLESRILSTVLGKDLDEADLRKIGERVFNVQRAILTREGRRGRESDRLDERCFTDPLTYDLSNPECVVPGPGSEVISHKGAVLDRGDFEKMKDDYYALRQWDVSTGLQTRANLVDLDLPEVADDLEHRGLLAAPV